MKKQQQINNASEDKSQRLGHNRQRRPTGPKAAVSGGVLKTRGVGGLGWRASGWRRCAWDNRIDGRLTCNVTNTCNHAATDIGLLCFLRWLCCFAYLSSLILACFASCASSVCMGRAKPNRTGVVISAVCMAHYTMDLNQNRTHDRNNA